MLPPNLLPPPQGLGFQHSGQISAAILGCEGKGYTRGVSL